MKTVLLFFILTASSIACHKDQSIGPSELLYQRWQWVESRPVGRSVFRPDLTRPSIITFKPSGEYIYEFNGKQFTCCQPNRFVRQGNGLIFSTVAGGYASPECAYVNCTAYKPEHIIDTLSAQRLVLSVKGSGDQIVYQTIP